jgi:hypothetical protein
LKDFSLDFTTGLCFQVPTDRPEKGSSMRDLLGAAIVIGGLVAIAMIVSLFTQKRAIARRTRATLDDGPTRTDSGTLNRQMGFGTGSIQDGAEAAFALRRLEEEQGRPATNYEKGLAIGLAKGIDLE